MGYHKITETGLERLHELADLQHPHLKADNYTRTLIDKVFNGEKLSTEEAFDCGKYYQRMLDQIRGKEKDKNYCEYLHAILNFKWQCK